MGQLASPFFPATGCMLNTGGHRGRGQVGRNCVSISLTMRTFPKTCPMYEGTQDVVMLNSHAFIRKASKKESQF